MLDIYNFTGLRGTNHVSTVYNDAAFLGLKFMVHVMLFIMTNILYIDINTFRRMCAVHTSCSFLTIIIIIIIIS